MEAQRARALRGSCLQEALRPELRHWVRYGNCLPLEQPAGHRKANCRVAQMHDFHRRPPVRLDLFTLRGGTSLTLSAQYQRAGSRTRHNSAIGWHRSNSGNTHQWMSTPGNSSSRNHDARANSRRADAGIHPSAEVTSSKRHMWAGALNALRSSPHPCGRPEVPLRWRGSLERSTSGSPPSRAAATLPNASIVLHSAG